MLKKINTRKKKVILVKYDIIMIKIKNHDKKSGNVFWQCDVTSMTKWEELPTLP